MITQINAQCNTKIGISNKTTQEKIENELTYPGHIKVTVIREIRANEVAK